MTELRGLVASEGIAVGRLFFLPEEHEDEVFSLKITDEQVDIDLKRLDDALSVAMSELEYTIDALCDRPNVVEIDILRTHVAMLQDSAFICDVKTELKETRMNVEYILKCKVDEVYNTLISQEDEYLRGRAVDIKDSYNRVLNNLLNEKDYIGVRFDGVHAGDILIAKQIKPSEAILIKDLGVNGIITEEGSRTSHMAIMAQAWNIPMVVGIKNCMTASYYNHTDGILDANSGCVIFDPSKDELKHYSDLVVVEVERIQNNLEKNIEFTEAITLDGIRVNLYANIAIPDEVMTPLFNNIEGIGLFRTEFLFLEDGKIPTEDHQTEIYSAVAKHMGNKPVTIRVFDIGADKMISEQENLYEKNPMLGWRGVRYFLDRRRVFKAQLRAILRSSVYGNIRLLIPMVSTVDEILEVKKCIDEAIKECCEKGHECVKNIPLGIMIEVPSAAILADKLSKYVDFMSIGTNDLIQYVMATDRENSRVAPLANYFQPSILTLVSNVVLAGRNINNNFDIENKISMCGEMASNKWATILLLAMGLRSFSMPARKIYEMKNFISQLNYSDTVEIWEKCKNADTSVEIQNILSESVDALQLNIVE